VTQSTCDSLSAAKDVRNFYSSSAITVYGAFSEFVELRPENYDAMQLLIFASGVRESFIKLI